MLTGVVLGSIVLLVTSPCRSIGGKKHLVCVVSSGWENLSCVAGLFILCKLVVSHLGSHGNLLRLRKIILDFHPARHVSGLCGTMDGQRGLGLPFPLGQDLPVLSSVYTCIYLRVSCACVLQGIKERHNLSGSAELGLKNAITHRDNVQDYGHLIYQALRKVRVFGGYFSQKKTL